MIHHVQLDLSTTIWFVLMVIAPSSFMWWYAFVAFFLIVCSWLCWHLQWQACVFTSSSDVVIIGFLCASALGISFVTGLWSLPSWCTANLSPMTFQFSPEITSLDYSWMQPIIVLNIYCSFSMSRRTLNLKWPSVLERVNLHCILPKYSGLWSISLLYGKRKWKIHSSGSSCCESITICSWWS